MDKPFWKYIIARGGNGYSARRLFDKEKDAINDEEFEDTKNPDWLSPCCPMNAMSTLAMNTKTIVVIRNAKKSSLSSLEV